MSAVNSSDKTFNFDKCLFPPTLVLMYYMRQVWSRGKGRVRILDNVESRSGVNIILTTLSVP